MRSSSSCYLKHIQAIIFGGQSSRFWLYRKHFMSFDQVEVNKDNESPECASPPSYPFFAWQCITLLFETRTLDLVIKKEADMDRLLRFLIQAIRTADGTARTADFLIEAATRSRIQHL